MPNFKNVRTLKTLYFFTEEAVLSCWMHDSRFIKHSKQKWVCYSPPVFISCCYCDSEVYSARSLVFYLLNKLILPVQTFSIVHSLIIHSYITLLASLQYNMFLGSSVFFHCSYESNYTHKMFFFRKTLSIKMDAWLQNLALLNTHKKSNCMRD